MSKGQKHMNLMNCHAACIYLPKEIPISCESLSLRELTTQVLLDLEPYRILINSAILGQSCNRMSRQHKTVSVYF